MTIELHYLAHYADTNTLNAVWVDHTITVAQLPDPAWVAPLIADPNNPGQQIPDPAATAPLVPTNVDVYTPVKNHWYSDRQIADFQAHAASFGTDLAAPVKVQTYINATDAPTEAQDTPDNVIAAVLAAQVPLPVPTVEGIVAAITAETQNRLDTFARTRGYDSILSACTYATSPTPKFAAEGQYCVAQRDATWATLYAIMGAVQAGTRPMPAGYADVEADLPALVWPV